MRTTKARKKPAKKKPAKKTDYKALAEELASHVLFALKFLDTKGGTGLRFNFGTQKATVWQEDFMDALDRCGYVIDRKSYWKSKDEKEKKKRRR